MAKGQQRNSNLELLRIISMMMIIGLHYFNADKGGALAVVEPGEQSFYITYILESFFIVGANLFVLISAYFLSRKESIQLIKPLKVLIDVMALGFIFYLLAVLIGADSFSIRHWLESTLPFFAGIEWFVENYILLYVLSPFLNILLNNLRKRAIHSLLWVWLIFFSLWPSFLPSPPVADAGYGIIHFIGLYFIGYYLQNVMDIEKLKNKYYYLTIYVISSLLTFSFAYQSRIYLGHVLSAWNYNFFINLISTVALFLYFVQLDIQSKTINLLASCTLTVYLFHENYFLSPYLYREIMNTPNYWHSPWMLPHLILTIVVLFLGGMIIELVRRGLFGRIEMKFYESLGKYVPFLVKEFPNNDKRDGEVR